MQVKRFVANDMRSVMRLVKEEIGAEAVILSNRVVNGKVEILAARDFDETLINQALDKSLLESKPDSAAAYYERAAAEREQENINDEKKLREKNSHTNHEHEKIDVTIDEEIVLDTLPVEKLTDKPSSTSVSVEKVPNRADLVEKDHQKLFSNTDSLEVSDFSNSSVEHQAAGLMNVAPSQTYNTTTETLSIPASNSMLEMRDELKSLRVMIENQHVLGEWNEMITKHPLRISLYKRLMALGLSQEMCKNLANGLDDCNDVEQAMQVALKQLVHQVPVVKDEILIQGGIYAMIGPTGVGKTTTIAKLAARFVMQHGQRSVALISTDTYRIGAHEQLMTYGRLLSVPVHVANDTHALQQLLLSLRDKKLILIDTAGMSQRDINLTQQLANLNHPLSIIKPYLVLSANAQEATLDEVLSVFKKAKPVACILTKLDEAASLGGVLSTVIKHQLPIAYVSHGQKVPEDIKQAGARDLVDDALAHAKQVKQKIDEDFMALEFSADLNTLPL